jgi:hypothetical protein
MNRFLQAGKGAENTKEKSRQCSTVELSKESNWVVQFCPKELVAPSFPTI